jgi:purine nucleosidase
LNVSKVLKVCEREEVPFYRGCETGISRDNNFPKDYFGDDGLGNCPPEFGTGPSPKEGHAAEALVALAKEHMRQITLVLIGPCSNFAKAQILDPQVGLYFKEIICMGGNLRGVGNITAGSEFNFACDPEAASAVLKAECPVTLVPWETITENRIPWALYKTLTGRSEIKSRFLKAICAFTERHYKAGEGFMLGDFLAVLTAIKPQAVDDKKELRLAVELRGEYTYGQLVQGWSDDILPDVQKRTTVVTDFDSDIIESTLLGMEVATLLRLRGMFNKLSLLGAIVSAITNDSDDSSDEDN